MTIRYFKLLLVVILFSGCDKVQALNQVTGTPDGSFADSADYSPSNQAQLLDKVARNYFDYFLLDPHPNSKMAREGSQRTKNTSALGASGYAVTVIPVAVERGWITYEQGAERFVDVCRFLQRAERYHGAWAHWIDGRTGVGLPFSQIQQSAGDIVETSFMMMGLLVCSEYFNRGGAAETEAIALTEEFWNAIDWKFYTNGENAIRWAWDKNMGFIPLKVSGYNEGLPTYILALAAPAEHAISQQVYKEGWVGKNYHYPNRTTYGYRFELGRQAKGGALFTSQHPFLWLDPYALSDDYADYYEFTSSHALINRHYSLYEAPKAYGYTEQKWGLSACYGPSGKDYKARTPSGDDGVITTTAPMGAISVIPYYALQTIVAMDRDKRLDGTYGITDAFSVVDTWADTRYLSISIMPVVGLIENYRTGLIWRLAMSNEKIRRGLQLAGFRTSTYKTGFCQMPVNSVDNTVDMVANPDTGNYSIRYWVDNPSNDVTFKILDINGKIVRTLPAKNTKQGVNALNIKYESIPKNQYRVAMYVGGNQTQEIKIRLR